MYACNELLFPPYAIPELLGLRGPAWQALVERVVELDETHPDSLAFSLMMMRLNRCLNCETDSYKAMRGCVFCAMQTIQRFKGQDEELLRAYEEAQQDVDEYMGQESLAPADQERKHAPIL